MKFIREHTFFVVLLCICAVLRLIPLFDYQYTLDELSGLGRTQFSTFGDLIEKGVKTTDTHPALIQVLIFLLSKCFGYANWVIKLPFLLFGFGAIIYAYFFCLRNFSKQSGIFATAIFSFSLVFVYYAPIARMYISGVFFSAGLMYYFFEILFLHHNRRSNYILLGLFAWLCALNQHISCLFALTVCASGVIFLDKKNAKPYLLTCALVVLFYLPHLPVTLYQFSVGGIGFDQGGWLPEPEPDTVAKFFKVLLGTGKTYLVMLALILLSLVLNRTVRLNKKQVFLLLIFMVNGSVIYFYSVFSAPVFQNSVMLFSSVPLILGLCSLLEFKNRPLFYGAATLLSCALLYKTYVKKDYYHECVKTVFEYQYERTDHYNRLLGSGKVHAFFFDADTFMRNIYLNRYKSHFEGALVNDAGIAYRGLDRELKGLRCDYVVLASSMPAQQALVQDYFPYLVENTQTQAINYKVYSRRESDRNKTVSDDVVLNYSDAAHPGNFSYPKLHPQFLEEDRLFMPIESANEFPFDAIATYSDVVRSEGQELLLRTTFKLRDSSHTQVVSCISIDDKQPAMSYMYNAKKTGDFVIRPDSTVTVYTDNFFGTPHKKASQHASLACYIWNKNKENVVLTGFEIKLIDYWHNKWHYWD